MATKKNDKPIKENPAEKEAAAKAAEAAEFLPGTDTPAAEASGGNAEVPVPEKPSFEDEYNAEHDRYLRLAAEYDNFRKRSQKEREALFSDIRGETILRLLPVYDNLARALSIETTDTAFKKGVEMTMAQLQEILSKFGVTAIPTEGKSLIRRSTMRSCTSGRKLWRQCNRRGV